MKVRSGGLTKYFACQASRSFVALAFGDVTATSAGPSAESEFR
jgi:hypothetical protein